MKKIIVSILIMVFTLSICVATFYASENSDCDHILSGSYDVQVYVEYTDFNHHVYTHTYSKCGICQGIVLLNTKLSVEPHTGGTIVNSYVSGSYTYYEWEDCSKCGAATYTSRIHNSNQ